jgi:hypothetical protein
LSTKHAENTEEWGWRFFRFVRVFREQKNRGGGAKAMWPQKGASSATNKLAFSLRSLHSFEDKRFEGSKSSDREMDSEAAGERWYDGPMKKAAKPVG